MACGMWIDAISFLFSLASFIIVIWTYYFLRKKMSRATKSERERERERFLSLDVDSRPDYNRFTNQGTTFPIFDFHAEPQGYLQIGQFLLNWGGGDHTGTFSRPFDISFSAVCTPRRGGGGEDNIKVTNLTTLGLNLRANSCERPNNFLACGYKKMNELGFAKVSRITVNDSSDKPAEMMQVAYVNDKPSFIPKRGSCSGGC